MSFLLFCLSHLFALYRADPETVTAENSSESVCFRFEWFHMLVFIVDHNYFSVVSRNCFSKGLVSFTLSTHTSVKIKKHHLGQG